MVHVVPSRLKSWSVLAPHLEDQSAEPDTADNPMREALGLQARTSSTLGQARSLSPSPMGAASSRPSALVQNPAWTQSYGVAILLVCSGTCRLSIPGLPHSTLGLDIAENYVRPLLNSLEQFVYGPKSDSTCVPLSPSCSPILTQLRHQGYPG